MSVQPTNPSYKRVPLPVIQQSQSPEETIVRQPATETMIPGTNFLPPKSSEPVQPSSLSPEQQRNLTSALGGYLRAQGLREPVDLSPEDACREGWLIARGPVPTFDPEVFEAIAKAFGAQATKSAPDKTLTDEEATKILSKPVAGSDIGLTLFDEYRFEELKQTPN